VLGGVLDKDERMGAVDAADARVRRPSQATLLVDLAEGVELFRTAEHEAYVRIAVDEHREIWRLNAIPFRRWLQRRFYEDAGNAPSAQAVQDALGVLEGRALFAGAEHDIHLRVAEHDGAVYIDLGDREWRAIRVTAAGWTVMTDPPVKFRRARGMLALPEPLRGGDLQELRRFVNVADDEWPLLAAWLVAALQPRGPYPVLDLNGEQGTAKSTTARVLRLMLDPNEASLRAEPRQEHDLMIAAKNGWLVAFDNLSRLTPWMSDALCRLATGGGFAARALYSDDDEVLFDAQRPVLLTGIEDVVTRGDLLDRTLVLCLPRIHDDRRRDEASFWPSFEAARPRIFGALLDALSVALARLPETHLERLPRMADFARIATAAEPALGLSPGAFMAVYESKRAETHELALEASPIASALRELASGGFEGTATHLHARLEELVDESARRRKGWPADPTRLSSELTRLAPNLRATGVEIERPRKRTISIRTAAPASVPSVHSAQTRSTEPKPAGANGTLHGTLDADGALLAQPASQPNGTDRAKSGATDATDAETHWGSEHAGRGQL
jgi:hypothetical protein